MIELWEWNLPSFSSKYTNHIIGTYKTEALAQDHASLKARTNSVNKEEKRPKYFVKEIELDNWQYK